MGMNRLRVVLDGFVGSKRCQNSSSTGLLNLISNTSSKNIYDKVQSGSAVLSDSLDIKPYGRLHYVKTGHGKHTLLLLPGALGTTKTDFFPQIELLDKDLFTVIAWDPPGYGQSRPERTWPLEFFKRDADAAIKLMQKLDHKSFSLLGWSDGGITGLIIAASHPDLIKKCVFWGANAYITKQDMVAFEAIRDISKWSEKMRRPFVEAYGEKYFKEHWNKWVSAYGRYLTEKEGDICKDELKKIVAPTLIIHGDKDPLVPMEHPKYLHENITNSKLIHMPDGKHNIHLRYTKEFNEMVTSFLAD